MDIDIEVDKIISSIAKGLGISKTSVYKTFIITGLLEFHNKYDISHLEHDELKKLFNVDALKNKINKG